MSVSLGLLEDFIELQHAVRSDHPDDSIPGI
ncbi:MAG: hypothetical protein ACI91O_001488, partial [Candidatus Poriferisodalaceae bacterium]